MGRKNEKVKFPFFRSHLFFFSRANEKTKGWERKKGEFYSWFFNFKWNWEISIKKIENQNLNQFNAGRFFEKSRVSLAESDQLQKRPKWHYLHKVLSAFQRLLQPAKKTSGNEKQKSTKKLEVFSLPIAMYKLNLKAFG